MPQFALPLEEFAGELPLPRATARDLAEEEIAGDIKSSEEKNVQILPVDQAPVTSSPPTERLPTPTHSSLSAVGAWPAGLSWSQALAYTGVSQAQLMRWHKAGALKYRRIGRNGAKVVLRSQLDLLLADMFGSPLYDIAEDFDFG